MTQWLACVTLFAATYVLNLTYISVFYHRGLAHSGVTLRPGLRKFIAVTGAWVTGLDPLGWACMHRMHHIHSDTPRDPHSPVHVGIFGVMSKQLKSYKRVLIGLNFEDPKYTRHVSDLNFPIAWMNRRRVWYLPYLLHLAVAALMSLAGLHPTLGAAYFLGMMSHPIQGWMVNALAHTMGTRNFDLPDNSRNNLLVALLISGEGFQNNHHRYPNSARFSYRRWEFDWGYGLCRLLEKVGLLQIRRDRLIPSPS